MTRSRAGTVTVGVLCGLLLAAVLVIASRTVFSFTRVAERTLSETCLDTPDTTDGRGVCVRRVERSELVVLPGRHEVRVFSTRNGAGTGGRYLVADDPFAAWDADRIKTRITPAGEVEVSNGQAVRLLFTAESIASLTS